MEGERCGITAFCAGAAYPPTAAECRNQRYAEAILSNVGGADSEMSAAAFYFYSRVVTGELPEVAEVFHKINMTEVRHLEIFATLARQLGADPRLWCRQSGRATWWTPGYVHYSQHLVPLLKIALRCELESIQKYRRQIRWIGDRNVVENLERIILDEEVHADIFRCLLADYGGQELHWSVP